jgi:hypothetical protein
VARALDAIAQAARSGDRVEVPAMGRE